MLRAVETAVRARPWSLYAKWQRWGLLAVLFAVCAANYFDYSVLTVLLDPIRREFRVSDTVLGLLSGVSFSVVYAFAAIPISRWADRGNRRTVMTVALAGWSLATLICGVAQSFWQLVLGRFGLGAAEPGAIPCAHSLIGDYFPPGERATPIAILNQGGTAVGWLGGVAVGGYLAAKYGWRQVFVAAGLVGLGLAVIVRLSIPEPRSRLGYPDKDEVGEGIWETVRLLLRKRSAALLIAGMSVYATFGFGVTSFFPSFMVRSLRASLSEVSVTWGLAIGLATSIGAFAGGRIGDSLSRRDPRWYTWLPSIACGVALPLYIFALQSHDLYAFVARDFMAELVLAIGLPSVYAAMHAVCGNRRRAMAIAILVLSTTAIGSSLGPLIVGALSDALVPAFGVDSLRYSMTIVLALLVPASVAFYFSASAIPGEVED